MYLAVLGTVGGGLAASAHEWLLQRPVADIAQRDALSVRSATFPKLNSKPIAPAIRSV